MQRLVTRYAQQLIRAALAADHGIHQPLVGGWEDEIVWNRPAPEIPLLEKIVRQLSINSLVYVRPRPPYDGLLDYLAHNLAPGGSTITPTDCETRTFLHELPVVSGFDTETVLQALSHHKGIIITDLAGSPPRAPAILAHGTVSPEQGFVTVSSICFACFVKFFGDYLEGLKTGTVTAAYHQAFEEAISQLPPMSETQPDLMPAPFGDEAQVYRAIVQAGRQTVNHQLVDSYFGNISYRWNETLYISQTGSSLDRLMGCIDPVPLDGSSSAGLTASSELSAHLAVTERTHCRAILHGHPKFAVILSMDCDLGHKALCPDRQACHLKCSRKRSVAETPIIPGEVGTGPHGLCHTLPPALETARGAIVYGHGLFTTGRNDFREAFDTLLQVENRCRSIYFERVQSLRR